MGTLTQNRRNICLSRFYFLLLRPIKSKNNMYTYVTTYKQSLIRNVRNILRSGKARFYPPD